MAKCPHTMKIKGNDGIMRCGDCGTVLRPTIVAERADADVYRMKNGNQIVGFAIKMSSGIWMQFGPEMAAPISKQTFTTPKAAAKAFPAASVRP